MRNRRDFLRHLAGATAGMFIGGRGLADAALVSQAAPARRRVSIGGRRITVVDVHAHTFVPEVWEVVKDTPLAAAAKGNLTGAIALGPGTAFVPSVGAAGVPEPASAGLMGLAVAGLWWRVRRR